MENWLPVPAHEGVYEVSDHGRVRSLDRTVVDTSGTCRHLRGRLLRPAPLQSGHLGVVLRKDRKSKTHGVHRLVAIAFLGPPPDKHEVAHGDGVASNNALSNLRWATRAENVADRAKHGVSNRGVRHGNAKLTREAVLEIRRRVSEGETQRALAAHFQVSSATVSSILSGQRWGWL